MKKILASALTLTLLFSLSNIAMASTGKGNGLATAPGQSTTFSKGVTTIVTVTTNDVHSTETNTIVSEPIVATVSKSDSASVVTGMEVITENHNTHEWTRQLTKTETTTTTTTWDEITSKTTTTLVNTPVTTTYTTVTTVMHQGAPGSNGKVISNNSITSISNVEYGTSVTSSTDHSETTTQNVNTTSVAKCVTIPTGNGWVKADGTPSTTPQGNNN